MKRLFIVVLLFCVPALSQVTTSDGKSQYDWAAVSGTGQLGSYLVQPSAPYVPSIVTIDWSVSGTAPSACTFRVEGSSDGSSWFGLDATAPAANTVPCTSSNMIHIADRPVRKVRIYIVSYTAGDATTSVKFHYTAGR